MDVWLCWWKVPPWPRVRLVALPPAGGGAQLFQPLAAHLPAGVELIAVEQPGHGGRLAEDPVTEMGDLVGPLATRLRALPPRPTALLGHSMGAAVALALIDRLREADPGWRPAVLFALAAEAPGARRTADRLAATGDDELRDFLTAAHAGTVGGAADRQLQDLVLPALRADLRLLSDHRPQPQPPLDYPVRVLCGAGDPFVTAADRRDWSAAGDDVTVHEFPGGHFFYRDPGQVAAVAHRIAAELDQHPSPVAGGHR
jgi:pyochelin biosynthesis protein PchC